MGKACRVRAGMAAAGALGVFAVFGATGAGAQEGSPMEMHPYIANKNTNLGRRAEAWVGLPDGWDGHIWISRDRSSAECAQTPEGMPPSTRWLVGVPGAGAPVSHLMPYGNKVGHDALSTIRPNEHGRLRLCAWGLVYPTEQGPSAAVWSRARSVHFVDRLVPTARERRALRAQVRRQLAPTIRMWARYGARAKIKGPRFSKRDPAFARVGVIPAARGETVQPGHTLAYFRNGRWRLLESPRALSGDAERWCGGGPPSVVMPPMQTVRELFGSRACP